MNWSARVGTANSSYYMGVSKNRGVFPPKWMVKKMENPIKMDDLGGKKPYFWRATHIQHPTATSPIHKTGINIHRSRIHAADLNGM